MATSPSKKTVLVTGAAGFVGMHTAIALLQAGHRVVGIDNLNDYYPSPLKRDRLDEITRVAGAGAEFSFHLTDIADEAAMRGLAEDCNPTDIIHLAAQPGARYSVDHPMAYAQSNLIGTTVVLELARQQKVDHLIYASSSSVYGGNVKVPYEETDPVDTLVSFYAATKRANEAMATSYAHLYKIPTTGLRFFTVYGPWGRPDMAPWLFTDAIENDRSIRVFGYGKPERDYTYIDDIVDGIIRVLDKPPEKTLAAPHRLLNIGNQQPVSTSEFIQTLESILGKPAIQEHLPMQPGDVEKTFASIDALNSLIGFTPNTKLHDGLSAFVQWFRDYHADSTDIERSAA